MVEVRRVARIAGGALRSGPRLGGSHTPEDAIRRDVGDAFNCPLQWWRRGRLANPIAFSSSKTREAGWDAVAYSLCQWRTAYLAISTHRQTYHPDDDTGMSNDKFEEDAG
jgi:hypothetical protein